MRYGDIRGMSGMTIEELEKQLNECQKALAELKESKKEGKWKPKDGEEYWFRNTDTDIVNYYNKTSYDEWRINNIPVFQTYDECERYWHFMDTVKEKSYEFSKEEWEDTNIKKHFIAYDNLEKEFHTNSVGYMKELGMIYFRTREDAQYIIDNFKEELMEYWL